MTVTLAWAHLFCLSSANTSHISILPCTALYVLCTYHMYTGDGVMRQIICNRGGVTFVTSPSSCVALLIVLSAVCDKMCESMCNG